MDLQGELSKFFWQDKFQGSMLSQMTKMQSKLSLVKMRRDQLIKENQDKFNFQNLDLCEDHIYIDLIFSECLYLEEMGNYKILKQ